MRIDRCIALLNLPTTEICNLLSSSASSFSVWGKLIGIHVEKDGADKTCSVEPQSQLLDDDPIWSSPEVIAAVDLAEKAAQVRAKYHEVVSDMPSFSLGMTQEYEGDGCGATSIEHAGEKIVVGSLNTEVTPLRVCEAAVVGSAEGGKSNPFNNSKQDENDANEDVGGMKRKSEEILQTQEGRRTRRKQRATLTLKSPYMMRIIDPKENANTKEKNIWKWVMSNPRGDRDEIVFKGYNIFVDRGQMMTLGVGEHISANVLDAWSCILNKNELFRSTTSPARFFAKSLRCPYTHEGNAYEADVAYKLFCDVIEYGWSSTSPCNVDLIFFPVLQQKWCYCLCVNLKSNRFEILDSSSENVSFDDKYDGMPKDIGDMVMRFFDEKGLGAKVLRLKGQAARCLEMPWRDAKTIHDYGVTTMRHMETYMGQSLRKWECGLTRGDQKPINALRSKYCAAIVESDVNELKDVILKRVKECSRA